MALKTEPRSSGIGERLGTMTETHSWYETLRASLFIILITAISCSFFAPRVSALEFTIDADNQVSVGEDFEVYIQTTSSEEYDVKIFVYRDDKNSYVSQIYRDGKWISPRLYLKGSFPSEEKYRLRVVNFTGTSELCVRLRKAGLGSYKEVCRAIIVVGAADKINEKPITDKVGENADAEISEKSNNSQAGLKREKIILGSSKNLPEESKSDNVYTDPVRKRIVYAFIFFSVAVIVLMWFKKI